MQHFYFSLQCLVLNKKQDLHPLQPYQTYQMIPYYTDVPILKTHIIYIFCVQPIACCHLTLFCKLAAAQCSPHYVTCQNKHKCTYFVCRLFHCCYIPPLKQLHFLQQHLCCFSFHRHVGIVGRTCSIPGKKTRTSCLMVSVTDTRLTSNSLNHSSHATKVHCFAFTGYLILIH